jgi:hypothetical protein
MIPKTARFQVSWLNRRAKPLDTAVKRLNFKVKPLYVGGCWLIFSIEYKEATYTVRVYVFVFADIKKLLYNHTKGFIYNRLTPTF